MQDIYITGFYYDINNSKEISFIYIYIAIMEIYFKDIQLNL